MTRLLSQGGAGVTERRVMMRGTLLLAMCLSLGVGACGDDDGGNGNPAGSDGVAGSELVGAWTFESSNIVEVFR